MRSLPVHFRLLLRNIEPDEARRRQIRDVVGELRTWLADHDFETVDPYSRLIGSYARSTAVLWVKDVDVLVFVDSTALDRTPNAVLLELREVLEGYPDAVVEASGQRRSVRVELDEHDVVIDVVPAVAPDGAEKPLKVPDRPLAQWIWSDPLGYLDRLSKLNQKHGGKVVRLVKLIKAWRDEQMKIRRPKSYMLEVMVVDAVESGAVTLEGASWPAILAELFAHWASKYQGLIDQGHGVPRIFDPQLGHLISSGWQRSEFETFMRRVDDASRAAQRAAKATSDEDAAEEWSKLFGEHWPSQEEAKAAAALEAAEVAPGRSAISSAGLVIGAAEARVPSQPTRFHGGRRRPYPRGWSRAKDRPSQQIAAMKTTFPHFRFHATRNGGLVWFGFLQPTPDSPRYPIIVRHEPGKSPRVFVPGHDLDAGCRHLYPDSSLCLYWPDEWRWGIRESLAASILPWAAFWLFYYELWQTTGQWLGPSSPHGVEEDE
jgi:hypothetical protein